MSISLALIVFTHLISFLGFTTLAITGQIICKRSARSVIIDTPAVCDIGNAFRAMARELMNTDNPSRLIPLDNLPDNNCLRL